MKTLLNAIYEWRVTRKNQIIKETRILTCKLKIINNKISSFSNYCFYYLTIITSKANAS